MAMASSADEDALTENLNCPICLDLLKDPVTLYFCFHSFCKECLEQAIQGARETYRNPYACPQCRRRFYPSDASKVNHHLSNIVNSHRKALKKIAEVKQYELQDMTSESRDNKDEAEPNSQRPSQKELDKLTTFLTAVDGRLQSLLTALDKTSIKTAGVHNEALEVETAPEIPQPRDESSQSDQSTVVISPPVVETPMPPIPTQAQHSECDFEAETLKEFVDKSLFIFKRHFLLIIFMVHLCLLVFCFVMAFV